jgi:hypothetical protein
VPLLARRQARLAASEHDRSRLPLFLPHAGLVHARGSALHWTLDMSCCSSQVHEPDAEVMLTSS